METLLKNKDRKPTKDGKNSKWIKILAAVTGSIGLGITFVSVPFITPAIRKYCLPFVPATPTQIENILRCIPNNIGKYGNSKLLDIGSGDGRIVIAAANHGLQAEGVELNLWLVLYSRIAALYNGVQSKTRFFRKDLWKFNISSYEYIVIFGVEQMMNDIQRKFIEEVKPEGKVIACRFPLPSLKPDKIIGSGIDQVWVYTFKEMNRDDCDNFYK